MNLKSGLQQLSCVCASVPTPAGSSDAGRVRLKPWPGGPNERLCEDSGQFLRLGPVAASCHHINGCQYASSTSCVGKSQEQLSVSEQRFDLM